MGQAADLEVAALTTPDRVFAVIFMALLGLGFWNPEFAIAASLLYIGYAIETRPK